MIPTFNRKLFRGAIVSPIVHADYVVRNTVQNNVISIVSNYTCGKFTFITVEQKILKKIEHETR